MANPIFEKQVLQELKNLTQAYVNLATYIQDLSSYCQSMGENLMILAQALQEENEELPSETSLETDLTNKTSFDDSDLNGLG